MTKICSLCEIEKPASEFYLDKAKNSVSRCKLCMVAAVLKKADEIYATKHERDEDWIDSYCVNPVPAVRGDWPADEVWRGISFYPAQYEVSDQGRVRSHWEHRREEYWKRPVPLILVPHTNPMGYQSVSLIDWACGDKSTWNVHSLVARAFICERPSNRHVVGHRDGNPSHNRLTNLGWITFEENESDKRLHGRMMTGAKNHQSKLTDDLVRQMRALWIEGALTSKELGARFGVSGSVAHKIVVGKAWKHVA